MTNSSLLLVGAGLSIACLVVTFILVSTCKRLRWHSYLIFLSNIFFYSFSLSLSCCIDLTSSVHVKFRIFFSASLLNDIISIRIIITFSYLYFFLYYNARQHVDNILQMWTPTCSISLFFVVTFYRHTHKSLHHVITLLLSFFFTIFYTVHLHVTNIICILIITTIKIKVLFEMGTNECFALWRVYCLLFLFPYIIYQHHGIN